MKTIRLLAVPLVAVAAAGCGPREKFEAAEAGRETVAAERDTLLGEVMETLTFVADVNTELAKVRGLVPAGEEPVEDAPPTAAEARARREATLSRIRTAMTRLDEADSRLARAETRIRTMTSAESRMTRQLAEYRSSLAELREAFEAREAELATQVESLAAQVDTLQTEATALEDSVRTLVDDANAAYVAIGTKQELIERGVVVEEGSKFLFFGSKRLEPARNLDTTAFHRIDVRYNTVISLPDGERPYRIVSRHSPQHLDSATIADGRARGELRITDPERFWTSSRFLILVRN